MRKILLLILLACGSFASAQTTIQSVNTAALITSGSSVSVGEIVVVPVNPNQAASGLLGILAQNQTLEVPQLEIGAGITAYPNPTISKIFFETALSLSGQKVSVYNNAGQLVTAAKVAGDNSLDLEALASGIYVIRFQDKKINSFKIIKH